MAKPSLWLAMAFWWGMVMASAMSIALTGCAGSVSIVDYPVPHEALGSVAPMVGLEESCALHSVALWV